MKRTHSTQRFLGWRLARFGAFSTARRTSSGSVFSRRIANIRRRHVSVEPLEARVVLDSSLVISELVASNQNGLLDYDDDRPDWLEIENRSTASIDLGGYYLTDDVGNLDKWPLPAGTVLEAGEQLVVFASDKNRVMPNGELHANFKLSSGGDYAALVDPDGSTVVFEYAGILTGGNGFPSQFEDVSYGLAQTASPVTLVGSDADISYLVPVSAGELDADWNTAGFSDPSQVWTEVAVGKGVGFDTGGEEAGTSNEDYTSLITTDVESSMHGQNSSLFLRSEFRVTAPERLEELRLRVRYDDGFVAYINGQEVARREAPETLSWDSAATGLHADSEAKVYVEIPLTVGSLLRDYNGIDDGTFVLDVPNGTYQVQLTQGDANRSRDEMAVYLEGVEVGVFTSGVGEFLVHTHEVSVSDGQLMVRIEDRGGTTGNSVLNALEIVEVGGTGARWSFDFGSESSPVRGDHEQVSEANAYSPGLGYGWVSGTIRGTDRGASSEGPQLLSAGSNVLAIQGLNVAADNPDFLLEAELWAVEVDVDLEQAVYMAVPTPGELNQHGQPLVDSGPQFSRAGGTYVDPFLLELTTSLPGAAIHYTLDQSLPTLASPVYDPAQPLQIDGLAQVRAIVVAEDHLISPAITETYIRLAAEIADFHSAIPIMVLDNLGNNDNPVFPFGQIRFENAYWAIFEPGGADDRASLANSPDLQTRAGARIRGNSSNSFPKKSFRLKAWDQYDQDKAISPLSLPVDADWILNARSEFDQSLMNNAFMFALSNETGLYAVRTRFVELFVNTGGAELSESDYLGVYAFMEKIKRDPNRVDIEKLSRNHLNEPEITGGYMLNLESALANSGELSFEAGGRGRFTWEEPNAQEMLDPARQAQVEYITNYLDDVAASLTDRDPDTGYASLIDVDNWIDYHLLSTLTKNSDSLTDSTYMTKSIGGKLKHGPMWDYDRALGTLPGARTDRSGPQGWHSRDFTMDWWVTLFEDPDFRQKYADRYQQLREGVWADANINRIVDNLADELTFEAGDRNYERWPTFLAGDPPSWIGEVDQLRRWVIDRYDWWDDEFIPKPVAMFGTAVAGSDEGTDPLTTVALHLPDRAPAGAKMYYTLDGMDPRVTVFATGADDPAGGVAPTAMEYMGQPIVVPEGMTLRARTFLPDSNKHFALGSQTVHWSGLLEGGKLALTELHYNPVEPTAAELAVDSGLSASDFEFVEIQNVGMSELDLTGYRLSGGVNFTFPALTLDVGEYAVVANDPAAFAIRYGAVDTVGSGFAGNLSNGGEDLVLRDATGETLLDFRYGDGDPWPDRSDGAGASLQLIDAVGTPSTEYGEYYRWRGSTEPGGSPGREGEGPVGIVINEVVARGESIGDGTDAVELLNRTDATIDVGGWTLTNDLSALSKYTLPGGTSLGAGQYLVVDSDMLGYTLNGLQGDAVWLLDVAGNGAIARFVDDVRFSGSHAGESFGLTPVSSRRGPLAAITLGVSNGAARVGPVLLSEIQYNSSGPSDAATSVAPSLTSGDLEYVELYNPTSAPVELQGWHLEGGVSYTFATGTTLAEAGTLLVLSFDPMLAENVERLLGFRTHYGIDASVALFGAYTGSLSNGGERVSLVEQVSVTERVLADETVYDDLPPWPDSADGRGLTLTRAGVDRYGPSAPSWHAAGRSPGTANLVAAGDVNLDGRLDFDDIADMVEALADRDAYEQRYGVSALVAADVNHDGVVDPDDIEDFVALLKQPK